MVNACKPKDLGKCRTPIILKYKEPRPMTAMIPT